MTVTASYSETFCQTNRNKKNNYFAVNGNTAVICEPVSWGGTTFVTYSRTSETRIHLDPWNMLETRVIWAQWVLNHSARSGGIVEIYFQFPLTWRYVVCSHLNRLTEAILKRTHNISFSIKKIILNYSKSAAVGFFPRDPRTSSKQPW